jgi:hypothetical protein
MGVVVLYSSSCKGVRGRFPMVYCKTPGRSKWDLDLGNLDRIIE